MNVSSIVRHGSALALGVSLALTLAPAAQAQVPPSRGQTVLRPIPQPAQAPAQAARAPLPGSDIYAPNLGIYYLLEPYGRALGARLRRYPVPGSAASQLQLEPGDMIISLDNQLIYTPNDVLAHVARTDVVFVNIRTGRPQAGVVMIPEGVVPLPPGPYALGIYTTPVIVYPTPYRQIPGQPPVIGPGAQPPRRGLQVTSVNYGGFGARAGLRPGDVIFEANGVQTETNDALRQTVAGCDGYLDMWVSKGGRYEDVRNVIVEFRPGAMPMPGAAAAPTSPAPAAAAPTSPTPPPPPPGSP